MKKIAFSTLGCKVNQADTASLEVLFKKAGYTVVDFNDTADVYLINTCVVTNMGQRKSRQVISRAIRNNPHAVIAVTGCYPQTAEEEIKNLAGIDIMVGNKNKAKVVELVEKALTKKEQPLSLIEKFTDTTPFEELPAGDVADRTRAFLKIQEGCNQFCTYCIIPYARGRLRSRNLQNIKTEVTKLVKQGYKEIVLIGIHLGCYGKETGKATLFDAVETALSVKNLQRLRLGSLESVEVEDRLLDLMAKDKRFCKHLHLPLQSGCDKILQAMHRPYDTKKFADLICKIRNKIPNIAITTDVIVGFPGETEEDFEITKKNVQQIGFAKIHIFPYSKRQGTPAAIMQNQLTEKEKAQRAEQLAIIDKHLQNNFWQNMLGKKVEVLFEQMTEKNLIEGHSANYQMIICEGNETMLNKIAEVTITEIKNDKLFGKIEKFIEGEF